MMKKQWTERSLDWVLDAWAEAAGVAGAMVPRKVAYFVGSLNWDANGGDAVDAYDIVEAVCDACRSVNEQCPDDPMPRGLEVSLDPTGSVGLVWESDNHKISLWFEPYLDGPHFASQCEEYGKVLRKFTLVCESKSEDSPRLAICEAAHNSFRRTGVWSI